jgi:hypothetical protein
MYKDITTVKASEVINVNAYNEKMQRALIDKIFFLDKVDATVFADYGCANGALLKLAQSIIPSNAYMGLGTVSYKS